MYLLNVHWQQQGRERKRKIVRESSFINDTDNFIFQIILNLLPEFFLLQQHMRYFSFIDLFFLDSEIFLIWIIKKIFYLKFSRRYWRVYSCVNINWKRKNRTNTLLKNNFLREFFFVSKLHTYRRYFRGLKNLVKEGRVSIVNILSFRNKKKFLTKITSQHFH